MRTSLNLQSSYNRIDLSKIEQFIIQRGGRKIVVTGSKLKFEPSWSKWVKLELFSFFTEAVVSINDSKEGHIITLWHNDIKWFSYIIIIFFFLTILAGGIVIVSIPISLVTGAVFYIFLKIKHKLFLKKLVKELS